MRELTNIETQTPSGGYDLIEIGVGVLAGGLLAYLYDTNQVAITREIKSIVLEKQAKVNQDLEPIIARLKKYAEAYGPLDQLKGLLR